jgi:hypothetical protein
MSPQEFKNNWEGILCPMAAEKLTRFPLLPSTKEFLTEAGFPKVVMPLLSFNDDSDSVVGGIKLLSELHELYPAMGNDPEYERYVVIGGCRDMDPIVVDIKDYDHILAINGKTLAPTYFNSSLETLADCLIIYRDFEDSILKEHGMEGAENAYFTDDQMDHFKNSILKVDPKAIKEDTFWTEITETWTKLRQEYLDS